MSKHSKNKASRQRGPDPVALAKVEMAREFARLAGSLIQGNGSGDRADFGGYPDGGGDPGSSSIGPASAGSFDTAHRGASQRSRGLLDWGLTAPVDPNLETSYDLYALRARSADLVRNNPIAKGAINRIGLNVVGPGLSLHPTIDRETLGMSDDEGDAWERSVKSLFDKTAAYTDLDVRGTENFYGLQELAFRSILERGEVFATLPIIKRKGTMCDLRVHLVEADRVTNPQLSFDTLWRMAGVETDVNGLTLAYWMETTPSWLNVVRTWERVLAFGPKTGRPNVLHLYTQQRIGDKRGVPLLSPVIEALKQISRYSEAELMGAVISAMFTVFIKTETGDDEDITRGARPEGAGGDDDDAQADHHVAPMRMGNGAIVSLGPNESIDTADPKRPNPNYEPFVQAHIRQIGMAIGVPYEVLVQHFSSSYSASRAALLEAWSYYGERRFWFASRFCQPVYEEWLAEMVLSGQVAAPGFFDSEQIRRAYCLAEWIGTSAPQLDPMKEVNAAEERVNAGFSTLERETRMMNGSNWERNFQQRAKEEKKRKALGLDFETNTNPITGADNGRENEQPDPGHPGQTGDSDTP